MTALWVVVGVVGAALIVALALEVMARLLARNRRLVEAVVYNLCDATTIAESGAVRSVQSADVELPREELDRIWSPLYLERLARTYWRFLSRVTLGIIHVEYTQRERFVVLFGRPFKLLTFRAPEYDVSGDRGVVRWRIERGLLVARQGRGRGYLQIEVTRTPCEEPDRGRVHVALEVANFYPAIAHRLSRWVYSQTQSRVHVVVTYAFLRSLARLDLAESLVGVLDAPAPEASAAPGASAAPDAPDAPASRGTPPTREPFPSRR